MSINGSEISYNNESFRIGVLAGKEISVEFDSPRAIQIDGETILGVTSYRAFAPKRAEVPVSAE